MTSYQLQVEIAALQSAVDRIKTEGNTLTDAKIDSAIPAGSTVGGTPARQYRLRVKGQKSRYLKASEVAETREAIARGKQVQKIEKQIQQMREQLSKKQHQPHKLIGEIQAS